MAQRQRTFTAFRQLHDERRLAARVEYGAGSLKILPGPIGDLYRVELTYDEARFVPVSEYNAQDGTLVAGIRSAKRGGVQISSRHPVQQQASLALNPKVDTDLQLALGAVEADIELGRLRVSGLTLETGASRTTVRFSQPNGIPCNRASVTAGAAELSVLGLGNSRCKAITFKGGAGKVLLDFSGTWTTNATLRATVAVGKLTLRLPRGVGVRLTMEKFLAGFQPNGLIRQGNSFVSPGRERAAHQLDIELTTAVGEVTVEWIEQERSARSAEPRAHSPADADAEPPGG